MTEELLIRYLFGVFGSSSFIILILLIYLFNRPDKFDHWMRIFFQVLYFLAQNSPKIYKAIDKKLVAISIQDSVNIICEKINEECPAIFPHALKIEWVKSDTPESFISKGKAVVRIRNYTNQDRNIVDSTLAYIKQGFLPRSKYYLDNNLRWSSETKIAARIFVSQRNTGAYDFFYSNQIAPALSSNVMLMNDIELVEELDSMGYFSRIFLAEVITTSQKALGTVPTSAIKKELRDFARFLRMIAIKEKDEFAALSFNGSKVKAAVILVAKRETINNYGIQPYIYRIQRTITKGYDSIYISAWGEEFIKAVVQIKSQIESDLLDFIRRYDYQVHGATKALLMVCQPKSSYLAYQKQLRDEVVKTFMSVVPEIKEGLIQIVSIARIERVGFKIAVRALRPDLESPCEYCIGTNAERLKKIKEHFPSEFIGIVEWSDDVKEFVSNAIAPLKRSFIKDLEIDEENLIADMFVLTPDAQSKGIGKSGFNVRLAGELTGYLIHIQLTPNISGALNPEEELMTIIRREIPEIINDEIEVTSLARIKQLGSKVIV